MYRADRSFYLIIFVTYKLVMRKRTLEINMSIRFHQYCLLMCCFSIGQLSFHFFHEIFPFYIMSHQYIWLAVVLFEWLFLGKPLNRTFSELKSKLKLMDWNIGEQKRKRLNVTKVEINHATIVVYLPI